jgi:DsbC/DsbD-like thiol-disulfide interchange protein
MSCERRRLNLPFLSAAVLVTTAAVLPVALAQGPDGGDTVKVAAAAAPGTVARGGKGQMTVTLNVKPGWHVYAADPGSPDYIPTTVAATGADGVSFAKAKFPRSKAMKAAGSPKPLNVYEGKAVIAVPFTVAKAARPGKRTLKATVGYQTCNDQMCLPPATAPVSAALTVK